MGGVRFQSARTNACRLESTLLRPRVILEVERVGCAPPTYGRGVIPAPSSERAGISLPACWEKVGGQPTKINWRWAKPPYETPALPQGRKGKILLHPRVGKESYPSYPWEGMEVDSSLHTFSCADWNLTSSRIGRGRDQPFPK